MSPAGQAAIARGLRGSANVASKLEGVIDAVTPGAPVAIAGANLENKESSKTPGVMDLLVSEAKASELPAIKKQVEKIPKNVKQEINSDPYYKALFLAESGGNPKAKNPKSSASGAFQIISSTAKN